MTDGSIYSIGINTYGESGYGTASYSSNVSLIELTNNTGKTPTKIGCGKHHTMILMTDGSIYGVGYNNYGQLGDGTTT